MLTQIKASLQVSYDLDQANTVTCDFISNSLEAEATSLGYHNPRVFSGVNNCGKKAPERGVIGVGCAIFTGLYPNWSKLLNREKKCIFDKRGRLNIKGVGKRKSFNKKNRSGLHPSSPQKKAAQEIQLEISSLKSKCKEFEEKMSASE